MQRPITIILPNLISLQWLEQTTNHGGYCVNQNFRQISRSFSFIGIMQPMASHFYKRAPKVKLCRAQNVHWSMTRNHKVWYFEISAEKFLIWFSFNKPLTLRDKFYSSENCKILMLCGEVQNVQTKHTNTHTFSRWEITLVLTKCKQFTWSLQFISESYRNSWHNPNGVTANWIVHKALCNLSKDNCGDTI